MMTQTNELNPLVAFSNAMADAVAKAGGATVMVDARRRLPASGIVFQPGLVLTADHVVERDDDLRIVLPDGSQRSATVAGRDAGTDLAVLRLDKPAPQVAEPAQQAARIGQLALALGRPSSDGIQASLGVVSAVGGPVRTGRGGLLENYLRTDTIPYPGFSGGPLIDAGGNVLGLNTSGLSRGMSLTIPVALAWNVAQALAEHGSVKRGYLGIRSQPVAIQPAQQQSLGRQQDSGLLIVWVEEASPAARGGLLVGDILVAINGQALGDPDELLSALVGQLVGQATSVEVLRGGQPQTLTVTVGER
jgi:S1-C subfamily serine protease